MAINPLAPPVNYLGMIPQLDLAKQFEGFGEALAERQKRTKTEEVKAAYATDLQTVLNNPSMKAFNDFSLKYPQQREVIKDVASRFTTEQQDAEFNIGRDIAIALENGNEGVALDILNKTIDARTASKLPPSIYGQIQKTLSNTDDPDRIKKAQGQTNFALTLLNPEKFGKAAESLAKQKLDPEVFKKAQAEAKKALQEAKNTEATAPDDIAKAKAAREREQAEAKLKAIEAEFARPLAEANLAKLGREKIAPSVQEALDFANLTPEQQKTFSSLQIAKKPAGAITNVNVTNLEKTAEGELGKLVPDLYNQANSAATQLTDLPRYRKALGIAITGPLANVRLDANRIGEALGFTGDKKINATRELIQGLSEMALKSRSMLTGQGAITDREQALLLQARSGDISFSKGELDIIFNVAERAATAQYEKSKKLLSSAAAKSPTAQLFLDNVEARPAAGALNPSEQSELDALRARFPGGKR